MKTGFNFLGLLLIVASLSWTPVSFAQTDTTWGLYVPSTVPSGGSGGGTCSCPGGCGSVNSTWIELGMYQTQAACQAAIPKAAMIKTADELGNVQMLDCTQQAQCVPSSSMP